MTEPVAENPPQPQPLNNYLVRCLNGWSVYVASPMDLPTFWKIGRADGYISADKMAINFANIVTVEYVGQFVPGQNVTPLGQPHLQLVP